MNMKTRSKEQPAIKSPITPAQRQATDEGEKRRQEYLATIDPRQREDLDPKETP
jgi:hypothetical protein